MKKLKQRTVLYKLILSYFIVLFVAILIFVIYAFFNVNSTFKQDMINRVTLQTEYTAKLIDEEFELIDTNSRRFTAPYIFENDTLYAIEIIDYLAINDATNATIESTYIYFSGDEYIISASSTYSLNMFFNNIVTYKDKPRDVVKDLYTNLNIKSLLPIQPISIYGQQSNYLTVIAPIYSSLGIQSGNAVYLIDKNTVGNWFTNGVNTYNASHFLVSNSTLIANDSDNSSITAGFFDDVIAEYTEFKDLTLEPSTIEVDGEKYYLFIERINSFNDTFYITIVPQRQQLLGDILSSYTRFSLVLGLITLLCSIIIVWVALKNYTPIKNLLQKASPTAIQDGSISEFEQISNAIDTLKEENNYLSASMEKNLNTISNSHLQNLLTGKYHSISDFNKDILPDYLALDDGNYFVAIFINESDSMVAIETICNTVNSRLNSFFQSRYIYTVDNNKILTINCIKDVNLSLIDSAFCDVQTTLFNTSKIDVTIGIGTNYTGVQDIAKSYLEAKTAIDYKFIYGKNSIIYYDTIYSDNNFVKFAYPEAELKELKNALKSSNHEKIDTGIANILLFIRDENLPLFIAKGICFDILKLLNTSHMSVNQKNNLDFDIVDLSQIDTMDAVIKIIRKAQMSLIKNNVNALKFNKKDLHENAINYVDNNCLRTDFSLSNTAAIFNMQPSNFSIFFKEITGQTLIDYVTDKRMHTAVYLLTNTDKLIDEICFKIGYQNTSSFIRRFKNAYKMTPGEYRKRFGKENK